MASHVFATQHSPPNEADSKYYRLLLDEMTKTKDVLSIKDAVEPLKSQNILTPAEYEQVMEITRRPQVCDNLMETIKKNAELKDMYSLDKALALWIHTLSLPPVSEKVAKAMTSADRLNAQGKFTAAVKACLVYIKFVDRALAGLAGAGFLVNDYLWRGIKFSDWVEGAEVKFKPGHSFHWFEMKSTSTKKSVADDFSAAKGTIFRIKPIEAYNIKPFSSVPAEETVVFRPLSLFRVDVKSPHHKAAKPPIEIHVTQEHSMRYVVMYGILGAGKTTLFQIATGSFNVGRVSGGRESVLGYNEAQTTDGKFTMRDVPGRGSIKKQDKHVEFQLQGLSNPNHALICVLRSDDKGDTIVNDIKEHLELFKRKPRIALPGIAFIITKCDRVDAFSADPEKWENDMRAHILRETEELKSTQLLFTWNMNPKKAGVDMKNKQAVIRWQRSIVSKWQDKLCDFMKANAQTRPEIYVNLDKSKAARLKLDQFIQATCGKGSWEKVFQRLEQKIWDKHNHTMSVLEGLGTMPSNEEQLMEFEAKVLGVASEFSEHIAKIKDEAAEKTREHLTNTAILQLLDDCWRLTYRVERLIRQECYAKLPYNPEDDADDNNKFRRCPFCRTIWMKVNGCTGMTHCGARVFEKDNVLSLAECARMALPIKAGTSPDYEEGYYSYENVEAQNEKNKRKLEESQKRGDIARFHADERHGVALGCRAEFEWSLQPRMSEREVAAFYLSIDNVHDSSMAVQKRQEKVIDNIMENMNQGKSSADEAFDMSVDNVHGSSVQNVNQGKKRKSPADENERL